MRNLAHDLVENNREWENSKLTWYLDAIAHWIEDTEWVPVEQGGAIPEQPSWRDLGWILYAGKIYE